MKLETTRIIKIVFTEKESAMLKAYIQNPIPDTPRDVLHMLKELHGLLSWERLEDLKGDRNER